ncbi:unnamed protein product [Pocillopora meandrina]|uniref:Mutator-like transposase domain-containing protein n=1 Tax=Pocillopora meandrina TaxID=46732 RepID=A0AAU9XSD1_9CNID|nr:unnamed protein product [Pocillopora meandrina]
MARCSLNALTFYGTKCYFCGFTLLNSCGEKNAVVSVLVGDEDSSTICKVRKNVEHEVEKWSDVVHAKRSFGSSLYSIKTQNKSLTDMVIQYFQQCFGYTLRQNMDDKGVQNGLKSIMPHAYGDHSSCGNWCGYLKKSCILQTQRPSPWQGSDRQKLEAAPGKDHRSPCFKCQETSSSWVEPGE